jgi:hypothetical protein
MVLTMIDTVVDMLADAVVTVLLALASEACLEIKVQVAGKGGSIGEAVTPRRTRTRPASPLVKGRRAVEHLVEWNNGGGSRATTRASSFRC